MMHGALDDLPYLPDLNPLPENYPAKRDEAAERANRELRMDPQAFAECLYKPMVGLIVFYKGCDMPCKIIEKRVVKPEKGLPCRGDVANIKQIKIEPIANLDLLGGEAQMVNDCAAPEALEVQRDGSRLWLMAASCAPLELHFDKYWHKRASYPEFRAVLVDALRKQKAFYPDLSEAEFFNKMCSDDVADEKRAKYLPTPAEFLPAAA